MSYDDRPPGRLGGSDAPSRGDGGNRSIARLARRAERRLRAVGERVRTHFRTWPRRYVEQQVRVHENDRWG